jgi:hypothetical protein
MMTHKDIVVWYDSLREVSWIFPANSRTVNLMDAESDPPEPPVECTCKGCYVKTACFAIRQRFHETSDWIEFQNSPACEQYISAEEVNGENETDYDPDR